MLSVKNLIDIDDLSIRDVEIIMENADTFNEVLERDLKKVPVLRGKTIINMFFEPSTRTRISFEIAAKRLSADIINFTSSTSSMKKGESVVDTIKTIKSMIADLLIIRHSDSGVVNFISRYIDLPIINAGDGKHQHPTQALLDLYTIKKSFGNFRGLSVAITGDILNSRVARSDILLFKKMGMDVSVVSAPMLLPEDISHYGVRIHGCIDDVIKDTDVLYMLRMQFERQDRKYYPSIKEYNRFLELDEKRLNKMKKNSLVMHPGPVNRGIEISESVMNLESSMLEKIKVNEQVRNGVAVRMALIYLILTKE
ncbi:MAG: Aspartate carbamoyltransferase [Actinobacteria bacterium ADurb.Bin346]|nr:MAG: Aspartate carbamoyltransferase [Actinobacteria bacterium ADurb.Bin346]